MGRSKYNYFTGVSCVPVDWSDKNGLIDYYTRKMMVEVSAMLTFKGLPETIPERELRRILQVNGWACIPKPEFTNGQIYALTGGLGGEPNPYYMPTKCVVSNPALRISKEFEIGKDCVIIRHDSYYMGLMPIIRYYASMMAEHDITMHIADINARIPSIASASDDRTRDSAEKYFKDIENGKLGIVFENGFLDGLKTSPYTPSTTAGIISPLIELKQYLKASFWNDCGVNANYNMKRESLNSAESQLNDDALIPLPQDIKDNITKGVEEVNALLGVNWSFELGAVWKDRETIQSHQVNEEPETGANNET